MPEFTITKKEAKKTIALTKKVINRDTLIPILTHVLVEIKKGTVSLSAFDLETYVTISPDVISSKGEYIGCVHGQYLEWFFNKALGDEIVLHFEKKVCTMSSGGFTVKVGTEDIGNFPKKPDAMGADSVVIECDPLHLLPYSLGDALAFVSNDWLRPSLCGVQVMASGKDMMVVSTDAHKLFFRSVGTIDYPELSVILRQKFCSIVAEYFAGKEFTLQLDSKASFAYNEKIEVHTKLIDGKYPNWKAVMVVPTIHATFKRKEAINYLEAVERFCNPITNKLDISMSKDKLKFTAGDPLYDLVVDYEMPLIQSNIVGERKYLFSLNSRFFLKAIQLNRQVEVRMDHTGLEHKAIIFDKECLVMPLMGHNRAD